MVVETMSFARGERSATELILRNLAFLPCYNVPCTHIPLPATHHVLLRMMEATWCNTEAKAHTSRNKPRYA